MCWVHGLITDCTCVKSTGWLLTVHVLSTRVDYWLSMCWVHGLITDSTCVEYTGWLLTLHVLGTRVDYWLYMCWVHGLATDSTCVLYTGWLLTLHVLSPRVDSTRGQHQTSIGSTTVVSWAMAVLFLHSATPRQQTPTSTVSYTLTR